VKKTVGGAVTVYHYDQNGQLIGESSASGAVQAEYVYLNGIPLAKIDGSGTQYIHTDHLGTPVMMTDAARAKVWEIENSPFGDGATVTGTANLNLRFPGQYYDAESGNHYNYFRDYNPAVGRYLEADPIGLRGGINPIAYVQNNPVNFIDGAGLMCGSGWNDMVVPDKYWGKYDFTKACSNHDNCYGGCGKSKGECDKNLYLDMLTECRKVKGLWRRDCEAIAAQYFIAVHRYGAKAY
jgi:RHS repeat-associated protein